jgi:hypothetical protein
MRRIRDALAAWNGLAGSPDDAPLWAEVCGLLLAPALFARAGVHVWVALFADVDPRLAPGTDVTVASPIRGLRGDRHDAVARLGVCGAGVAALGAWPPAVIQTLPPLLAIGLTAQIAVLLADPALYAVSIARNDDHDRSTTDG